MKNGELELREDMVFQRREWKAERFAWVLMFLIVAAALLGLTGKGGISSKAVANAHLKVEYERFTRRGSPDKINITFLQPLPSAESRQLLVTTSDIRKVVLNHIVPEPTQMTVVPDGFLLTFSARAAQDTVMVTLEVEPEAMGNLQTRLQDVQTGSTVQLQQFIYP